MTDQLKIMIADPDPEEAAGIRKICASIPGVRISGVAHSKGTLLAKARYGKPDLILLSLAGDMAGVETVELVKKDDPELNVVILYSSDDMGSDDLVLALEQGAYECIGKPGLSDIRQQSDLRLRLMTITGLLRSRKRFSTKTGHQYKSKFFMTAERGKKNVAPAPVKGKTDIVVIASSTGGPEILSRIFSILPGNLKVPVLLVQHIPEKMTRYFAKSLNEKSELDIRQAEHGDQVLSANVYLAPGGRHMTVTRPDSKGQRSILLSDSAPVKSVRPSADILFESVARSYSGNILAVVLTGMGEDGKNGVCAMKEKGCWCITQTAETCVVYGMPRAVDEAGLSDEQLDPLSITQKIVMMTQ